MERKRDNVILMISDTFRFDAFMGLFNVKNKKARVPNLEEFRKRSIVFTRAYTASFPTVPHRHDVDVGKFTFTYYGWAPLPKNEIVLPEMLRTNGYISMLIADTPHILKDGFNYDRGFDGWVWIRGQENDRYRTAPKEVRLPCKPEKLRKVETTIQHMRNNYHRYSEEDYIPAKTAKEAIRWLEENYREKFFLWVDFFDPHEPWDPPKWYVDMYDPGYSGEEVIYPVYGPRDYLTDEELEHIRALYAAEVTLVDRWIGAILEKVEALGLYENTTIIFTSDHGFYLGEHGLVGKSIIVGEYHGHAPLYEEVSHIPLAIRFSDKCVEEFGIKQPYMLNGLVQPPDITATILDIAGVDFRKLNVQGETLLPYVRGEKNCFRELTVTSPSLIHGAKGGVRPTVVYENWMAILASAETPSESSEITLIVDGIPRILKPLSKIETELYDLNNDPKQENNLADKEREVIKIIHRKFIQKLREWRCKEDYLKPWYKIKIS